MASMVRMWLVMITGMLLGNSAQADEAREHKAPKAERSLHEDMNWGATLRTSIQTRTAELPDKTSPYCLALADVQHPTPPPARSDREKFLPFVWPKEDRHSAVIERTENGRTLNASALSGEAPPLEVIPFLLALSSGGTRNGAPIVVGPGQEFYKSDQAKATSDSAKLPHRGKGIGKRWIWIVVAGAAAVAAGGITAGVVVGTRRSASTLGEIIF